MQNGSSLIKPTVPLCPFFSDIKGEHSAGGILQAEALPSLLLLPDHTQAFTLLPQDLVWFSSCPFGSERVGLAVKLPISASQR